VSLQRTRGNYLESSSPRAESSGIGRFATTWCSL